MVKIFELNPKEIKNIIKEKKVSVGIVGFGYIGSCIGGVLADKGLDVTGIDTNLEIIKEVSKGTISINEPGLKELIKKGYVEKLANRKNIVAYHRITDIIKEYFGVKKHGWKKPKGKN